MTLIPVDIDRQSRRFAFMLAGPFTEKNPARGRMRRILRAYKDHPTLRQVGYYRETGWKD